MSVNDNPKMSRSERLRLIAFRNVEERKKMTTNERARIQAFKNVQERKQELNEIKSVKIKKMHKTFTEFLYGKDIKQAFDCFENKLNSLELQHSAFLKDNNIDFKETYIMTFNNKTVTYSIINKKVKELMSSDFAKAFRDCFSSVLSIAKENNQY